MRRTFHAEGRYHGRFKVKKANFPRIRCVSRMVHFSEANLPCWRAISRMVRYKSTEPSMLKADIMDGSISRGKPSTLYARIVDGSRSKGRTFHAEGRYHGRFNILSTNLPRCMPESWMVRGQKGEPSTLEVDIMEGSISKGEPSTLYARIVDGSRSKG